MSKLRVVKKNLDRLRLLVIVVGATVAVVEYVQDRKSK